MFKNAYIQYQYFNIQILTNKISQYRFAIIYIILAHTINQQTFNQLCHMLQFTLGIIHWVK